MATKPKKRNSLVVVNHADMATKIASFSEAMSSAPGIKRFDVSFNRETGVVRYNAHYADGRVITQTDLGPGLREVVKYDPRSSSRDERDAAVRALLEKGLTQTDTAARLGISQALVSKIYRSSER